MAPQFLSKSVSARAGGSRIVGNGHLKFDLEDPVQSGVFYPAIGFGLGDKMKLVRSGESFDVVYSIEKNEWNGKVSLQLNVKDIKEVTST
jgi:single-stranded-DNA-specific exonuclease